MAENMVVVGSKVQAGDELGRCESAKVLQTHERNRFLVQFPGWDTEWDRWVSSEEIRFPVLPIEEQRRRRATVDGKCWLCNKPSRLQLQLLTSLSNTDFLEVDEQSLPITTIDRFNREFVCEGKDDATVVVPVAQAKAITDELPERIPSPMKRRKSACIRKQEDKSPQTSKVTSNCPHGNESNRIFHMFGIECGGLRKLCCSNLTVAVTHIEIEKRMATGWPVINNSLDQVSTVTVPLNRLHSEPVEVSLSNMDKEVLKQVREDAKKAVKQNLAQSLSYRRLYRQATLASQLKAEIAKALHKTHHVHRWDIGLLDPDVDSEVFEVDFLSSCSTRYNYILGNWAPLDKLLGDFWDLQSVGNNTRFVSALTLRCRNDMLSTVIHTAAYAGPVTPGTHRAFLSQHIVDTAASLTLPAVEDKDD